MLYLVATPIGNLGDLSFRAVDVLRSCDYVLCEDTRHSRRLLSAYDIAKPLKSYHKFSEAKKLDKVVGDLNKGLHVALISDAGTPGIADPGSRLINQCIEEGIELCAIPGPCAAIVALTLSGFNAGHFQFLGFLPRKEHELRLAFVDIFSYAGTTICYESANRLVNTLKVIEQVAPERRLCIAREMTKKFEEIVRGTPQEVLKQWEQRSVKGEIVLLIEGQQRTSQWEDLSPQDHVATIERTYGITRREAIKIVAEMRGMPKRTIYAQLHG